MPPRIRAPTMDPVLQAAGSAGRMVMDKVSESEEVSGACNKAFCKYYQTDSPKCQVETSGTYEDCGRVSQICVNLEDRVICKRIVQAPQVARKVTLNGILRNWIR